MSDALNAVQQAVQTPSASDQPAPNAGLALRAAREASGMHVATLAAVLKVPVDKLQALEAGRFDELPNLTFVRALAQSVCRVLKIDPKPILQALPQQADARLEPAAGALNAPMPDRRPAVFSGGHSSQRSSKAWVLAVAVVVLAGVLWWVLPRRASDGADSAVAAGTAPGADASVPVAPPEMPKEVVAPSESRPVATTVEQVASVAVHTTASPAPPAPAAVASPVAVAPAPPAPIESSRAAASATPVATPETDAALRLVARQPTWVQVMSGGKQVLQRTLQAGESLAVPGNGTLSVTVGRVDEAEVYVRGQRFDLAPYTRNNVARFEVK